MGQDKNYEVQQSGKINLTIIEDQMAMEHFQHNGGLT